MQNKWMTREEFENAKCGTLYCWIAWDNGSVIDSLYSYGKYYKPSSSSTYDIKRIKAVMPIEKPGYPKEVE